MANPTTNYGWPMPTSTDLVTDLPADFALFGQPVDTSLKALNPETTLGDIAYRSSTSDTNTRLGIGTNGQVLAVSSGVPAWTTTADVTPLTTKGDVFTFSTVDARIGVGANNTVLTADSAEATGLKWATPSAGGGMTLLSTTTLSSTSTTISSISGSYQDLLILVYGKTNSGTNGSFYLKPNDIAVTLVELNTNTTVISYTNDPIYLRNDTYAVDATSAVNSYQILIRNYANTVAYKPFTASGAYTSDRPGIDPWFSNGAVKTNSAISSLVFYITGGGSFTAGTVKVYGVN